MGLPPSAVVELYSCNSQEMAGRNRGGKRVQLLAPDPAVHVGVTEGAATSLIAPAPASDRLGPLLRMYSELSAENKTRAFDFISQLHALEAGGSSQVEAGAPPRTGSTVSSANPDAPPFRRRRPLSSPPPGAGHVASEPSGPKAAAL